MITFDYPNLYQWDIGHTVTTDTAEELHFALAGDTEALVVVPTEAEDAFTADVPNILLQRNGILVAWRVIDGKTTETVRQPIAPRAKPQDYVYEETTVESYAQIKKWFEDSVAELEAQTTAAVSAANAAAAAADSAKTSLEAAAEAGDFDGSAATVSVGTVTTLDAGQSATVTNSGTTSAAVLDFGIPKGDKGDKGDPGTTPTVVAADGSDLSVSSEAGTVTIDDSALRARIEDLENASRNVVTGTSTGPVAHGEDAFPQKPIETRIKGKTWVNRWPVIDSGTNVTTDDTGLITVNCAPGSTLHATALAQGIAPNKTYTLFASNVSDSSKSTWMVYIDEIDADGGYITSHELSASAKTTTFSVSSNCAYLRCLIRVYAGYAANLTTRVMLVDGTEAPDCFTPCASITSAQPENLVTSGKNLANAENVVIGNGGTVTNNDNSDGSFDFNVTSDGVYAFVREKVTLTPGTYRFSAQLSGSGTAQVILNGGFVAGTNDSFTVNSTNEYELRVTQNSSIQGTVHVSGWQLELGSTATAYEPPTVTTTPLPEVELRSLSNGTCDELVIKADGTCEVERRTAQKTIDAEHQINVNTLIPASGTDLPYVTVGYLFAPFDSASAKPDKTVHSTSWPYTENLKSRGVYRTWNSTIFVDERFTDKETAQSIINETGGTFIAQVPATTEPQSPVTLPTLPAPTFNQYHDSAVPSDTSTTYARDINLVLANLEAVQDALLGADE